MKRPRIPETALDDFDLSAGMIARRSRERGFDMKGAIKGALAGAYKRGLVDAGGIDLDAADEWRALPAKPRTALFILCRHDLDLMDCLELEPERRAGLVRGDFVNGEPKVTWGMMEVRPPDEGFGFKGHTNNGHVQFGRAQAAYGEHRWPERVIAPLIKQRLVWPLVYHRDEEGEWSALCPTGAAHRLYGTWAMEHGWIEDWERATRTRARWRAEAIAEFRRSQLPDFVRERP